MTPDDMRSLFSAPRIHTDTDGKHRDDAGREYTAVDIRGEVTFVLAEHRPPAALGLAWAAEHEQHLDRWSIVGRDPGVTHARVAEVDVRAHPGGVSAEEIARVIALLLNECPEGAASLMGADLMREKDIDHG